MNSFMYTYQLLYLCVSVVSNQFTTIHEIDYEKHLGQATFTPVLQTTCDVKPFHLRTVGMHKNYYGYLPYWIDTTYYQYFQMELLTHIAYFSVEIDEADGSLGDVPNQERFLIILNMAHENAIRVHMTFNMFGSSCVSNFLNNAAARLNAINNIRDFITNYCIEGANIDFEFVTSSVRDSFNLFINDLATTLWNHSDGRKELYVATIAVPEWYPGYDIAYLAEHADGLYIMAYDFHWSGDAVAGPVSPCVPSTFWGDYCVAKSIGDYKAAGVSGIKIILGLPYYGYDWPTVSDSMGSATTGSGSGVIYYYAFANANTYGRLWDSYSLTPWYTYYATQWHQCWYDDSISLDIKYGMVNDSTLQGAGCWALGYDRSYDHIWNSIRRHFWDPTSITEQDVSLVMNRVVSSIVTDELNLFHSDSSHAVEIEIYDRVGRKLIHINPGVGPKIRIGTTLCPGVYFLIMKTESHVFKTKIIKVR